MVKVVEKPAVAGSEASLQEHIVQNRTDPARIPANEPDAQTAGLAKDFDHQVEALKAAHFPDMRSRHRGTLAPLRMHHDRSVERLVNEANLRQTGDQEEMVTGRATRRRFIASNADPYRISIANHGLSTKAGRVQNLARVVSRANGSQTIGILNPGVFSHIVGFSKASVGLVSSKAGRYLERENIEKIVVALESALSRGFSIHCSPHSHGVSTFRNALWELKERYDKQGPQAWEQVAKRISVHGMGAVVHGWPPSIEVQAFAHDNDWVAQLTGAVSRVVTGLKRRFGAELQDAGVVRHDDGNSGIKSHGVGRYVRSIPKFFIGLHEHSGGTSLAVALSDSIGLGRLSDFFHDRIIEEALKRDDAPEFSRRFLARLDGYGLGGYEVPANLLQSLREVAKR